MDNHPAARSDFIEPASYRYDDRLPPESMMLEELLKATEIQQLFESFYNLINIPLAIIDLHANVLLSSRWRRICTQFHRVHPVTCARCIESDTKLAVQLQEGKGFAIYTCENGLTDCASRIILEGRHVANVFIGQFLTHEPDENWFRRQAQECTFDVADYLAALREVPIVAAERIPSILDLLARMTRLITTLGIERERAVESQARQSVILNAIPQSVFWKDTQGRFLGCNMPFAQAAGFASPEDIVGKTDLDLPSPRQEAEASRADDLAIISASQLRLHVEEPHQRADGSRTVIDTSKIPLLDAGGAVCGVIGVCEDISERKRAESLIQQANIDLQRDQFAMLNILEDQRRAEEALRASEERFRTLIEKAPTAIGIGRDGVSIYANQKYLDMFGIESVGEIVGRPIAEDWSRESAIMIAERARQRSLGSPVPTSYEAIGQRKDGSQFSAQIDVAMVNLPDGPATLGFLTDITERKRAEEELRRASAYNRSLIEASLDPLVTISADGKISDANTATEKVTGVPREELLGTDFADYFSDPARARAGYQRVFQDGWVQDYELEIRHRDGRTIPVVYNAALYRDEQAKVMGVFAAARDVTERKRAEEKIKGSEEKFRKAFMTGADAFYIATLKEGRIIEINDRFEDVYGYSRDEVIGKTSAELSLYEDPAARERMVAAVTSNGYVRNLELKGRKKSGELITILLSVNLLRGSDEQIILGVARDVTEQKHAQESLVRLRQAVDATSEVVFMTDRQGVITFINPEFTRLYGYSAEQVVGKTTPRVLKGGVQPPEKYTAFWQALFAKQVTRGQILNKTADGRLITVEYSASPIQDEDGNITGFLAIQRDVTEHKRLEEQFIQAQKMEAVGRLAAGVAHDFNNLLTVINGRSDLMLKRLPAADPARESFAEIKDAGERAAGLTHQLLAFSRQQVRTSTILDLNTLVSGSIKMLRRLIGEDIQLVFVPAPQPRMVSVDVGQVEQVLLNLAVNARDAMPQGGKLTIGVSDFQADEGYAAGHYPMPAGNYVMLAVSDTGCGMDAKTQSRIFEPFFTTKEQGKGTGLGLATVYGIVKQNGGYIWVYSELGKGASFKIYLPAVVGTAAITEAREDKAGGSETVLLVEDEVRVRSLARMMLESEGYKVLEAPGGMEALLIASQHKGTIHLLLTDVVMPVMSGRELAERLAKSQPQMKILYMSGYTDDTIVRHGVLESGVVFLQKPFSSEVLARKVREVLDT